jgi:hypothetical protein
VSAVFEWQETDTAREVLQGGGALLLLGSLVAAAVGPPAGPAVLLAAALLCLGLSLTRGPRTASAGLFEHGLVTVDRRGRPTAVRWSDVVGAGFVWKYRDSDQSVEPWGGEIAGYTLRRATGGDVVLPRASGAESLQEALEAAVVGPLARQALARCGTDGHVDFGTVRLTADTIAVDEQTPVAWREITSCEVGGSMLRIRGRFGRRTRRDVRLDEVPDGWVLVRAVVHQISVQSG